MESGVTPPNLGTLANTAGVDDDGDPTPEFSNETSFQLQVLPRNDAPSMYKEFLDSGREGLQHMSPEYLKGIRRILTVSADTELVSAPAYLRAAAHAPALNNFGSAVSIIQDELAHAPFDGFGAQLGHGATRRAPASPRRSSWARCHRRRASSFERRRVSPGG